MEVLNELKMKKHFLTITIIVFFTSVVFSQSENKEQQLINLSKIKFEWMINKNCDSLNSILDERLKYIHSNGWIQTKQDVIDDLKSGKIEYQQVITTEATVRFYDNTAILTGKGKFSGLINKTPFALDLVYTEVYIKIKNKWLRVSRHASKI